MRKRRVISALVVILLLLSLFSKGFIIFIPFTENIIKLVGANPGNITTYQDTSSSFSVTVMNATPTFNYVDLVLGSTSKLDTWIDVNIMYNFVLNVTCASGWAAVQYINITAWYDNGSESSTYNESGNLGGNLNMFLQYDNTSGTAIYTMIWPDDEATAGAWSVANNETYVNLTTRNITFPFTPLYQVRHSSGDGDGWDSTSNIYNDIKSWNFNITVDIGDPAALGYYVGAAAINIQHRANGNFTLKTEIIGDLQGPGSNTLANTTVGVQGGNLSETKFPGNGPLYIWGTASTFEPHPKDNPTNTTSLIYHCDIPFGTAGGTYTQTVTYDIDIED